MKVALVALVFGPIWLVVLGLIARGALDLCDEEEWFGGALVGLVFVSVFFLPFAVWANR